MNNKTPKDMFEKVATAYAATVDIKPIHIYYHRPNFLSLLPEKCDQLRVLDVGCGSGWLAEYLVQKGADVTAIDASPTLVQLTRQRLHGKGDVHVADLEEPLDFLKAASFDLIVAPLVIHYVKEWIPLFTRFAKVLKKNGILIFSTHQPHSEVNVFHLENYYEKVLIHDHWKDVGEVTFYHHTLHELSEGLHRAGFVIERMLEPPPLPEMQNRDPDMYKNITTRPWVLFVKAILQR